MSESLQLGPSALPRLSLIVARSARRFQPEVAGNWLRRTALGESADAAIAHGPFRPIQSLARALL